MIWLIILGIIVVILLLPIKIFFEYHDGPSVRVKLLFFTVYKMTAEDGKESHKKQEKRPSDEKSADEKEENPKVKKGLRELWSTFKPLVEAVFKPLRFFLRRLKIHDVNLQMMIGKGEGQEDQTAIACGQMYAAVYSGVTLLSYFFKIKYRDITILPEYEKDIMDIRFSCTVRLNLFLLIATVLIFLLSFVRIKLRGDK